MSVKVDWQSGQLGTGKRDLKESEGERVIGFKLVQGSQWKQTNKKEGTFFLLLTLLNWRDEGKRRPVRKSSSTGDHLVFLHSPSAYQSVHRNGHGPLPGEVPSPSSGSMPAYDARERQADRPPI